MNLLNALADATFTYEVDGLNISAMSIDSFRAWAMEQFPRHAAQIEQLTDSQIRELMIQHRRA